MICFIKLLLLKAILPLIIVVFISTELFAQPTITSFNPLSGTAGSNVTITGTGFNTTPAQNIVYFGATMAVVTSASTTSLTVTVPLGTTYQNISVTNLATNLTGYSSKPYITTYINGGINIQPKVDFATGSAPNMAVIADLDGDRIPDLVTVNYNSNTISVFRNTSTAGNITYAAKIDLATGNNPCSIAYGDLDRDGKLDLIVTNYNSNSISIYRNTSTSGNISFAAKVDITTNNNPYCVAIGDIDKDGKPDIIETNIGNSTVSVFRNISTSGSITTGSFAAKVDFMTGYTAQGYFVTVGDIEGDGKPEIVITSRYDNIVSVYHNTSTPGSITTGSFDTQVNFSTGNSPYFVVIGDIDGDGKPDLEVTNYAGNTVSVLRNTSTSGSITSGSFATKVDFTTGTNPYFLAIYDLDGDGKPDLTVANCGSNSVSVLRNTSTSGNITSGSFATKIDFIAGTNPYYVAICDIDGDGKPDIISANYGSNTVSILRNILLTNTWTGALNTDWHTSGNWDQYVVPVGNDVLIPNVTNKPIIGIGNTGTVKEITINSSSSLTNNGTFQISGSMTNNGTFTSTSGNVTFNGTSVQTTNGITGTLASMTINNSSGVTLSSDVNVANNITLTTGLLNLDANNLTLGSSATVSGTPGATNMIVSTSTGELRKIFTGTGSFTFPVGDNIGTAEYSPITLNFTSGTFSSAYAGVTLSNAKFSSNPSTTDYLNRSWTVNQSGISGFSCNVTAQYLPADVIGSESNIYGGKYSSSIWTLLNKADAINHQITGTVTGFSTFTGGQQIAMPIELASFSSVLSDRSVKLQWTTASEANNLGFEIQKSNVDNQNAIWDKIGYVNGKGTKTTPTNYNFTDVKLCTGKYQYRLKQIDDNGNFKYYALSGTVEIDVPLKFSLSQNYPNPFNPKTKIDFQIPNDAKVTLKIFDIAGKEVATLVNNEFRKANYYTINFNATNFASGIYLYKIIADKFIETKKMMVIK